LLLTLCANLAVLSACGSDGSSVGAGVGTPPALGDDFAQGHVVVRHPQSGELRELAMMAASGHYDRCDNAALFEQPPAVVVHFTATARLGRQTVDYTGVTPQSSLPGQATLELTKIDEQSIEGWISGPGFGGSLSLDTCGWLGQSLVRLEACALSVEIDATAKVISPSGRLAVADFDGLLRVFRPIRDASGCRYELDADYGGTGRIELSSLVRQLEFDAAERLYGSAEAESGAGTASLLRVTPGAGIDRCLFEGASGLGGSPPDEFLVMPDGATAYGSWREFEWRWDLTSPALGDGTLDCHYEYTEDGQVRYAPALSVHADGLLFRRRESALDGPINAEVTDFALEPVLRFGGSRSGRGILGLTTVFAGARCPAGYCLASGHGLAVYGDDGAFRGYVRWQPELDGVLIAAAEDAIEGGDSDAWVLLDAFGELIGVRISE
jgi:hypothetical protein